MICGGDFMQVVWGYILIFSYVFMLIFCAGPLLKKKTDVEFSRKTVHIALFVVWVLIDLFMKNTVHQVIVPFVFLVLNWLSYKFHFYKSLEREENDHMGIVYFAAAVLVVMTLSLFFPSLYLPGGAAIFCLTFGDGFAALIGSRVSSRKIREHKSVAGYVACGLACMTALFSFRALYWPQLPVEYVFLLAGLGAVAELTEGGKDNFTVTGMVMVAGWAVQEMASFALTEAFLWGWLVFQVVFLSGAIDYPGSLLSMAIVFVFRYFGGRESLFFLLLTYFTIFILGKLYAGREKEIKQHQGRVLLQIFINGILGLIAMLYFGLTGEKWLQWLAVIAIGGNFIDSLSSDAGRFSAQLPYDFFHKKSVEKGMSGGMTVLGTGCAMVGSLLTGVYSGFVMQAEAVVACLIGVMVFAQTLLDTWMGSILQAKYQCCKCGKITEKKKHCSQETDHVFGKKWMDNNMVNMISSGIIVLISIPLLIILVR